MEFDLAWLRTACPLLLQAQLLILAGGSGSHSQTVSGRAVEGTDEEISHLLKVRVKGKHVLEMAEAQGGLGQKRHLKIF